MVFGNGVKSLQAAAYNGARTVPNPVKNSIKASPLASITKTSSLYHVQKRPAWGHCQCQSHSFSLPISYTGSFNF